MGIITTQRRENEVATVPATDRSTLLDAHHVSTETRRDQSLQEQESLQFRNALQSRTAPATGTNPNLQPNDPFAGSSPTRRRRSGLTEAEEELLSRILTQLAPPTPQERRLLEVAVETINQGTSGGFGASLTEVQNAAHALMKHLDLNGVSPDLVVRGDSIEHRAAREFLARYVPGSEALLNDESFRRSMVGAASQLALERNPNVQAALQFVSTNGAALLNPQTNDQALFLEAARRIAALTPEQATLAAAQYSGPNADRIRLLLTSGADSVKVLEMRAALLGDQPIQEMVRLQQGLNPEQLGMLAGGYQHIFGVALEDPRIVVLRRVQGDYQQVIRKQHALASGAWANYEELERQRENLPWIERSLFGSWVSGQDEKLYNAGTAQMEESERLRAHAREMATTLATSRRLQEEAIDLGNQAAQLLQQGKTEEARRLIEQSNQRLSQSFETIGNPRLLIQTDQNREDMQRLVNGLDASIQAWNTTETVLRTTRTVLICTAAGLATGGLATGAMGFGSIVGAGGLTATYGTVGGTALAIAGGTATGTALSTVSVGTENTIHVAQGTKTAGEALTDAGTEIWQHTQAAAKSSLLAGTTVGVTVAATNAIAGANAAASGTVATVNSLTTGQRIAAGAAGSFTGSTAIEGTSYGIDYYRARSEFEELTSGTAVSEEERAEIWHDVATRHGVGDGAVSRLVTNIGVNTVGGAAGMHFGHLRNGATGFLQNTRLAAGEALVVGGAEAGAMALTGDFSAQRLGQGFMNVALGEMGNQMNRGRPLSTLPRESSAASTHTPAPEAPRVATEVPVEPRTTRAAPTYDPGLPVGAGNRSLMATAPAVDPNARFDTGAPQSNPAATAEPQGLSAARVVELRQESAGGLTSPAPHRPVMRMSPWQRFFATRVAMAATLFSPALPAPSYHGALSAEPTVRLVETAPRSSESSEPVRVEIASRPTESTPSRTSESTTASRATTHEGEHHTSRDTRTAADELQAEHQVAVRVAHKETLREEQQHLQQALEENLRQELAESSRRNTEETHTRRHRRGGGGSESLPEELRQKRPVTEEERALASAQRKQEEDAARKRADDMRRRARRFALVEKKLDQWGNEISDAMASQIADSGGSVHSIVMENKRVS